MVCACNRDPWSRDCLVAAEHEERARSVISVRSRNKLPAGRAPEFVRALGEREQRFVRTDGLDQPNDLCPYAATRVVEVFANLKKVDGHCPRGQGHPRTLEIRESRPSPEQGTGCFGSGVITEGVRPVMTVPGVVEVGFPPARAKPIGARVERRYVVLLLWDQARGEHLHLFSLSDHAAARLRLLTDVKVSDNPYAGSGADCARIHSSTVTLRLAELTPELLPEVIALPPTIGEEAERHERMSESGPTS